MCSDFDIFKNGPVRGAQTWSFWLDIVSLLESWSNWEDKSSIHDFVREFFVGIEIFNHS